LFSSSPKEGNFREREREREALINRGERQQEEENRQYEVKG